MALRAARSRVQRAVRSCVNKYWTDICQDIQLAADTENIRGIYDGIKKAIGPAHRKTAPL